MTCSCRSGATCGDCLEDTDLTLQHVPFGEQRVSSPAFYEERIRLLTEERDRAEAALREIRAHHAMDDPPTPARRVTQEWMRQKIGGVGDE